MNPIAVATTPESDAPPGGDVVCNPFRANGRAVELLLRSPDQRVYELTWRAGDRDQRRRVPEGTYALLGYRISRRGADGKTWLLSTTANGEFTVPVAEGRTIRPPIDPRIHLRVRVGIQSKHLQVAAKIRGELWPPGLDEPWILGLSIYRDGIRLPLFCRALDANGETVLSSPMSYG